MPQLAPVLGAAVAIALTCGAAHAQSVGAGPVTAFPAEFFASAQPYSALDMLARLPGFTLDAGDAAVRGLSGAVGNVLVDGQRPTSKQDTLEAILRRIPAAAVARIELIRPGAPGIDMQGAALVANVVRKAETVTLGRIEAATQLSSGGRTAPMISGQMSHKSPGRLMEVSVKAGREVNDRKGSGHRQFTEPTGAVERGAAYREFEDPDVLQATAGFEQALAGGKLRLDAVARRTLTRARIAETITVPSSSLVRIGEWDRTNDRELGARFQGPLMAGWRLDALGLVRERDTRARDAAYEAGGQTLATESADTRESIVRTTLQRDAPNHTLILGAEAALNRLVSGNGLVEQGRPVVLPTTDVQVTERRAEAFVTGIWRPSPRLTLEGGLRYEASRLEQGGEAATHRSLGYLKPRGLAVFKVDARNELRLEVERKVGQLDFEVFVTSASLSTGTVSAGNPEIRPDQTWRSSLTWERRLGAASSAVLTLRHDAISDAIDRVPVLGGGTLFDAPGNIGNGTRDEASLAANLALDRLGIRGGQLKVETVWRRSAVTDPTTGASRRISGEANRSGQVAFSQDLPAFRMRWGGEVTLAQATPRFLFNEVRTDKVDPRVGLFVEYRPTPDWNIRLRGDNLTSGRLDRRREQYRGSRDGGAMSRIETRSIGYGPYVGLTVERLLRAR